MKFNTHPNISNSTRVPSLDCPFFSREKCWGEALSYIVIFILFTNTCFSQTRKTINFNADWKFKLTNDSSIYLSTVNDNNWRTLSLPHDWSIESDFVKDAPATNLGGSLPGGIGWYRKSFTLNNNPNKIVSIKFDGVYRNAEVWINEHYLGKRPNGYVNFEYDISNYLKPYPQKNIIAVKVDNSLQPNSRWYTGSGIYRDVFLEVKNKIVFVKKIFIESRIDEKGDGLISTLLTVGSNVKEKKGMSIEYQIFDKNGKLIEESRRRIYDDKFFTGNSVRSAFSTNFFNPIAWSIANPYLYKLKVSIYQKNILVDNYETTFGIRSIKFDKDSGFYLNNKPLKIQGVCLHHDLGLLGAAFNKSAAQRQLQILKNMGCNAIRFSHNPPAAAMLDLCDQMGFLVIDEAFDQWYKKKIKYDYSKNFSDWYKQDLEAMVLRDRNHPSIIMWSIGNEIREQFDTSAIKITNELVNIVKQFDNTRPITSAMTETNATKNFIAQSNALDVLGFNYKDADYSKLPTQFPNQKFIATETASALSTRGVYQMPSDTNRIWPPNYKVQDNFLTGNADNTCAAYDNTYAYWGNTHERSWLAVKKNKFMAGAFVWSGFDYLGEPTPYQFPARSSYFGIVDLAGFPKDVYYMYQSEWTNKPVLHLLPHWNWNKGDTVDVWSYYNNADKVELLVNNVSKGFRTKTENELHVLWRVPFEVGVVKIVSYKNEKIVLTKEIKTAGEPYRIKLLQEKKLDVLNKNELCFVQAIIEDKSGNIVPNASNEIIFNVNNDAILLGTDNGYQADLNCLKNKNRNAWKGKCLAIVQLSSKKRNSTLTAKANGLITASIALK